ncbi:MAG: hypothetical protein ACKOEC_03255 [Acidimicrobiia bacterium]
MLCLLLALVAACQGVIPPQSYDDRCSGLRDDHAVAAAIGQSRERLERLRDERLLGNDDLCTMPRQYLARAVRRLDVAKPDRPGEGARWRAMGLRDDSGEIRAEHKALASEAATEFKLAA